MFVYQRKMIMPTPDVWPGKVSGVIC